MNNKNLTIILIVILSFFVIVLTGGLVFLLNNGNGFKFNFDFEDKDLKLIEEIEKNTDEVNKLYFNVYSTDIKIIKSENDKLLVKYFSNRDNNSKIEYSNNTIIVNDDDYDVSCVGFCNTRRRIVVYVPNLFTDDFEIITKSGDVVSEVNLNNNNVKITTMSGDVKLSDTGITSISTSSGDVLIDNINEETNISTSSGDVLIKKLSIKNNSNVSTSSGDVIIRNNDSNCYIDASTVSGDQLITNSNRKSDLVLKIKTSSGDISVN